MVFLPLMAKAVARLDDTKVLPEPGFIEVTMITKLPLFFPRMNSRLVRTTRNASLMISRLCGFTRIFLSSSTGLLKKMTRSKKTPRFCTTEGSSPTNGVAIFLISSRPRTVVLLISSR